RAIESARRIDDSSTAEYQHGTGEYASAWRLSIRGSPPAQRLDSDRRSQVFSALGLLGLRSFHRADRRLLGGTRLLRTLLLRLRFHRHDLAAERRELFMARCHGGGAAPEQRLHDELQDLDFAFRKTVADTHGPEASRRSFARQWLTSHVASRDVMPCRD